MTKKYWFIRTALVQLATVALVACGHQETAEMSGLLGATTNTTFGSLLDCEGYELNTTPKGQYGDITLESHKYCNGLYAKDVVVVFNLPNLTPAKSVAFGERGVRLDDAKWLTGKDSRDWLNQTLSVVHLGTTNDGRDRFALRKRHVGYHVPVWELRVSQGQFFQSIQF